MSTNSDKKVIVAMSGGVDSSVSAWLLQQQGYQVEGVFMKNWEDNDNDQYCHAANDLADTRSVCDKLGIVLHKVNFAEEYWNNVFEIFLDEYQMGRTPNPDILCNKEIKFKTFLDFATQDLNAYHIATGHYVRRLDVNGKSQLLRGKDDNKDQSYFLYTLGYEQISKCLFPVGKLTKPEVRHIATELKLITATKKDSTGICFIGKYKFSNFISRYLAAKSGVIMTVDGQVIGKHHGLIYYTIGQRKGLLIGGIKNRAGSPWYVVDKDLTNNILIVAQGNNHPRLMSTSFIVGNIHWIDRLPLKSRLHCTVKIRYRQPDIDCLVEPLNNGFVQVTCDRLMKAVTPGQSAVFYLAERCLGGGIIEER